CTVVGLSVEDLSEAGGPFLGVEDVEFLRPVHPGDTLTARSRVVSRRESESRPGFGIVTWESEGRNQRGEAVVSYRRTNLVAKRGAWWVRAPASSGASPRRTTARSARRSSRRRVRSP